MTQDEIDKLRVINQIIGKVCNERRRRENLPRATSRFSPRASTLGKKVLDLSHASFINILQQVTQCKGTKNEISFRQPLLSLWRDLLCMPSCNQNLTLPTEHGHVIAV